MPSNLSLREIEKKVWLRTFEHGLWDLGIGSLFLMFGISILAHMPALAAIWVGGLMPGLREIGRKLVVPRIGTVHFRARRKRAMGRLTGILAATSIIGAVAFALMLWISRGTAPAWAQWIGAHFVVFIGLVWGGAVAIGGWLVDFPRLYAYGVLIFCSLLITDLVPGYHLGLGLTLVSSLIVLAGIVLLVRFIRRYPKQVGVV